MEGWDGQIQNVRMYLQGMFKTSALKLETQEEWEQRSTRGQEQMRFLKKHHGGDNISDNIEGWR